MEPRKKKVVWVDSQSTEVDLVLQCNTAGKERKQNIVEKVTDADWGVVNTSDNFRVEESFTGICKQEQECEIFCEDFESVSAVKVTDNEGEEEVVGIESYSQEGFLEIRPDNLVCIENQVLIDDNKLAKAEVEDFIPLPLCGGNDLNNGIQYESSLKTETLDENILQLKGEILFTSNSIENQILGTEVVQSNCSPKIFNENSVENFVEVKIKQEIIEHYSEELFENENSRVCKQEPQDSEIFMNEEEKKSEDTDNENSGFDSLYELKESIQVNEEKEEEEKCEGEFVLNFNSDGNVDNEDDHSNIHDNDDSMGSESSENEFQDHFLLGNISKKSKHSIKSKTKKRKKIEDPDWTLSPSPPPNKYVKLDSLELDKPLLFHKEKKLSTEEAFILQNADEQRKNTVKLKCPLCPKEFMVRNHYNLHMKIIHKIIIDTEPTKDKTRGKKIECKKCEKIFHHVDGYKLHMEHVHKNKPIPTAIFECHTCGRMFVMVENYERHLKLCQKLIELKFRQETKQTFITPRPSDPLATISKVTSYPCSLCSSVLKTEITLGNHMQFQHRKLKSVKQTPI